MAWQARANYSYVDVDGQYTGYDAELIRLVSGMLNCKIVFLPMTWKRSIIEIQLGNIDIMASASKTKERAAFAHFSEPYRQEKISIFINKEKMNRFSFHSIAELFQSEISLVMIRGAFYGKEFNDRRDQPGSKLNIFEVNNFRQPVEMLAWGHVDAYIGNPVIIKGYLKKLKLVDKVVIHPLLIHLNNVHYLLSKKNISLELLEKFDAAIIQLKQEGTIKKLMSQFPEET